MIEIKSGFNTVTRLKELVSNLGYLDKQQNGSEIQIAKISFVTPLSITPISAVVNEKKLKYNYAGENSSYLQTIRFPEGIQKIDAIAQNKTYLPIIHLDLSHSISSEEVDKLLGALSSKYLELLKNNIVSDPKFLELLTNNTFGLLLTEMFDNIKEHSQAKHVYLFAQYWAKNDSCEICIVDDGQGLYNSLKKAGRDVNDSEDALRKILETGLSAKDEFGEINRGTGIRSTRAALTSKEIHGEFFIMSGDAAFLHSTSEGEKFVRLSNYDWNGTIVMLRFNKPSSQFDIYKYIKL